MKILEARIDIIIMRYFLMMFVVIGLVMTNHMALVIVALPLFIIALLGVKFIEAKTRIKNIQ